MFSTVATRYLTLAIQIVVVFLTLEVFGLEGRGTLAALIAISGLSGALLSFTIGKGLIRVISESKNFKRDRKQVYSSFLLLVVLLTAVSIIFQLAIYNFIPVVYGSISTVPFYSFLITSFYYVWVQVGPYLFSFEGKLKSYNSVSLLSNLLILSLSFYFYSSSSSGFICFLQVYSAILFTEAALGFFILVYSIRSLKPNRKYIKRVFLSGATLHLDTIGGVMFSSITLVIVNAMLGLDSVAIYEVGIKLFSLLCVFPQMVQLYNSRSVAFSEGIFFLQEQLILFIKVVKLFLILIGPLSYLLYLLLNYFGYDQKIAYIFIFFSLSFPAYFYCSIISQYWIKHGFGNHLSMTTLMIGAVGALIAIVLVKTELALYGAVIAVVFNYTIAAVANYIFYRNILSERDV